MYNIIVILTCLATVIAGNVCNIQREDAVAGQDYTLILCLVDEPENNSTMIYMTLWKKKNISLKDIHSDILFFSPLNLSDADYYSCEVEVSAMHFAETFDEERNNTWLLQVKGVFECYTSVNQYALIDAVCFQFHLYL